MISLAERTLMSLNMWKRARILPAKYANNLRLAGEGSTVSADDLSAVDCYRDCSVRISQ